MKVNGTYPNGEKYTLYGVSFWDWLIYMCKKHWWFECIFQCLVGMITSAIVCLAVFKIRGHL